MSVFFSARIDLVLAFIGMVLLLFGFMLFTLARAKMDYVCTWARSEISLGIGIVFLAFREWVAFYGLAAEHPRFYILLENAFLLIACFFLFRASFLFPDSIRKWKLGPPLAAYFGLVALVFIALRFGIFGFDRSNFDVTSLFLVKLLLLVPAGVAFLLSMPRERDVLKRGIAMCQVLFVIFALLLAFSPIPAITHQLGEQSIAEETIGVIAHGIRMIVVCAMVVILWWHYAETIGASNQAASWPILLALSLIFLSAYFYIRLETGYGKGKRRRLAATTEAATFLIAEADIRDIAQNGENSGSIVLSRLFARTQSVFSTSFPGLLDVDPILTVAVPAAQSPVIYKIDEDHPEWVTQWIDPPHPLAAMLGGGRSEVPDVDRGVSIPLVAYASIHGGDGRSIGALVASVPPYQWVADMTRFKRTSLLFILGLHGILVVFLHRHFGSWLTDHASGMTRAWRDGVLGHGLAGVAISENFIVTDVNSRFRSMRGTTGTAITGRAVADIFSLDRGGEGNLLSSVAGSLRKDGETLFETVFHQENGQILRVQVRARELPGSKGSRHIWECVDITRQKEMESRLRESRDFFQTILDTLPVPVLVKTFQGTHILANQAFASLFGRTTKEIANKRDQDLVSADEAFYSRQQDAACRILSIRGETFIGEITFVLDGVTRQFEVYKTAKRTGATGEGVIISVFYNLTERKRGEDELSNERHFLRQVLNILPPMVCFVDTNGIIRLCDASFCAEVGKALDEILGKPYSEVAAFPGDDPANDRRLLAVGQGDLETAIEIAEPDGAVRNLMLRRSVLHSSNGRILGLVKAFWDTTQLVAAMRAAESANRAKTAFLANMSHELRTPLNGIVGMADMILNHESSSPEIQLWGETIVNSSKALQSVLDEVMDFATREEDALAVSAAPFDLRRLVEEAVQIESSVADSVGAPIKLFITSSLAPGARGDARRLRQILIHTLSNCCRWADSGGIRLAVRGSGRVEGGRDVGFAFSFTPRTGVDAGSIRRMLEDAPTLPKVDILPSASSAPLLPNLVEKMSGHMEVRENIQEPGALSCDIVLPLPEDDSVKIFKEIPDLSGLKVVFASRKSNRREAVLDYFAGAGSSCLCVDTPETMFQRLRSADELGGEPYHIVLIDSLFIPRDAMDKVLADIKESPHFGAPRIMVIAAPRDLAFGLSDAARRIDAYLATPLLPTDLWMKAERIWDDIVRRRPTEMKTDSMRRREKSAEARRAAGKTTGLKIKARVLLVEDNPVNQMVAKGILNRIGCLTSTAKNGLEAVGRIKSGEIYDLILMDCMMPVLNGYDATRQIRLFEQQHPETKRHTIAALTANALPGDREKCLAAGMDGYMTKPVTLEAMRENIIQYCPGVTILNPEGKSVPRPD